LNLDLTSFTSLHPQLRIDGRLLESFPYPEIGKGIFHEYLRGDDPMSADARERFCDGFPFLVAPLAQLKGFVSKQEAPSEPSVTKGKKTERSLQRVFGDVLENVNTRTSGVLSWVEGSISGGISNANSATQNIGTHAQNVLTATQNIGSNLQNFGSVLDKRRDLAWDQIVRTQQQSFRMVLSRLPFVNKRLDLSGSDGLVSNGSDAEVHSNQTRRNIFVPQIAKMLGDSSKQRPLSDEIGVMIAPKMNFTHQMFLYLVHFYLVLLLIVSIPDSSTTRLVVKRSSDSTLDSDSDHDERFDAFDRSINEGLGYSCKDGMDQWNEVPGAIPRFVVEKDGIEQNSVDVLSSERDENEEVRSRRQPITKSLSYFL